MPSIARRIGSGLAEFIVGSILWVLCMGGMVLILMLVVGTIGYVFSGEWFGGID